MTTYVSTALRQLVTQRADGRCEYCRFPQLASFLTFEIEHIISEKHSGATEEANLALACPFCNRNKGTDLGSLDPETGLLTAFFNPRTQRWDQHFRIHEQEIIPLSPEGRVTVRIFQFNHPERIAERRPLLEAGLYD